MTKKIPVHIDESPIVISLFDYSGEWSLHYRKAGYRVIQIDTKLGIDIFAWDYRAIRKDLVKGILAAPPCTDFTVSGAQYWKKKDEDGTTEISCQLISVVLEIIDYFQPEFFAIENPVGRLRRMLNGEYEDGEPQIIVPDSLKGTLAAPALVFNPCDYGDAWMKKTMLWGKFNSPEKNPVQPEQYCKQGSWTQLLGGKSERTKELRSVTPKGFSSAFFAANS